MGNYCCKSEDGIRADLFGELRLNIGLGSEGITENFQYHDVHIHEKKIQLDMFDMFFREIANPLYLLKFEDFKEEMDSLLIDD
mmetsp:Transcript_23158/g.35864  ORF Transcript_23158/g.35864 Transcript_23158/m.35864 type:complete len:83 (+) Transcript_23158:14-262(+)